MVVDDDQTVRETLRDLLEAEGYDVTPAANGREALDRLHGAGPKPHLILLDLMMPVMDGWQFSAAVKLDPTLARIPVVVFSADASLEQMARRLPVDGVLLKPVDLARLRETVERFC